MLLFSKFVESPLIYSDGLNLVPGNISLSLRDGHIIQLRQRPGLPYLSCFMTKVAMPHEGNAKFTYLEIPRKWHNHP